jgi:hypothetical protein
VNGHQSRTPESYIQSPQMLLSQHGSRTALMATLSHCAQRSFSGMEATSIDLPACQLLCPCRALPSVRPPFASEAPQY